jgi:hypothetical protein
VLTYALAVLAACANGLSSVLGMFLTQSALNAGSEPA